MPNRKESTRRAPEPGLLPWFATPQPTRLTLTGIFTAAPTHTAAWWDEPSRRILDPHDDSCPNCGSGHGPMDCPYEGCLPGEHCPTECPYEDGHTDWDHVHPRLPDTMHRGMSLRMSRTPGYDPGAAPHDMARAIADHLRRDGIGTHWTPNEHMGRHYAAVQHRDGDDLHVILHARKPDLDDIETDPHELLSQDVIGFHNHADAEIPLRRHAPVHITGISWRHPDSDSSQSWTHHDFSKPLRHTANLTPHTAMPSQRHDRPEGFTSRIERYEPNQGPGGWYGNPDWHTERITGFHEGDPVASIDYHVHPQGHALKVDKMDSFARGRGHASALMDDLLAAHPHALINMGHYTPDGSAWRAQYQFPEPERDVHHLADQPHLWAHHFSPDEVADEMARNRQTNRHHGRPDQYLPPIDPSDEDDFEGNGMACDGPCTRCQEIQHHKDHPPVEEPDEEPTRPQAVPEAHDPMHTGWHTDHRVKLSPEDTAFVHDRRNPTSERAQRILQAIDPANLPTRWHPSAGEAARHHDELSVQVHDPDTFETRVRLHSTPGSEPTHLDNVQWWGKNPILHGGFHRFPEDERPPLPAGGQHTASSKPWLPHDRYFGPGRPDLDPRLFDGEHLKPSWRRALLALAAKAFAGYGPAWSTWARVYLAGSQASHWYGNDDLDVLIGVDYAAFRRALPRYRALTDAAIDDVLNADAHRMCDPARWFTIGGKHLGPFDSTLYVNHDSYDIRKIKPYAAYDLTGDRWAVKPVEVPADFSAESLPSADFLYARSLASQVRALRKLPAGQAQALGSALYDRLHSERHDAFSGHGGGLYDVRNVAWKYLALHPEHPMEQLVAWKRAEGADVKTAAKSKKCHCCDGVGEHANGHECAFCDASGDGNDTSGPIPCQGALAEVAPVEYRDGEYRSTCPCGTPVHFDDGNGWRHADTSYGHDDGECVSDKMYAIASPGFGIELKRTATFEHVTLPNPQAEHPANRHARHDEWFHASRHPFDHPGDFADDDTFDSEDGAEESQGAHWNTGLGVHWTSRHDVANSIARNRGHDLSYRDEDFDDAKAHVGDHETPRVFHAKLHIKNPKVYASEHDMDRDAYAHEYEDGNHPSEYDDYDDHDDILNHEEDLRTTQEHMPDRFAHWITHHPDRHGITYRFQQRLSDAGHDGIIYGNEVETAGQRANRHPSAIVFHPAQAEITQVHRVWEPCLHGRKLDDFRYPRPGQEALPGMEPGMEHLGLKGPGSDADFAKNSAMIALVPPRSLADKLVQQDGEPADQMHVTLAYIPDVGADRGAVHRAVTAWASKQQPIRCRVQGAGTFVTSPPSPHVEHALVDVHRGSDLHSGLLAHLEGAGLTPARDHGFTAHITLAYRKHRVRFLPKITPEDFTAHHVYVCHGDDWKPVPLGGATAAGPVRTALRHTIASMFATAP